MADEFPVNIVVKPQIISGKKVILVQFQNSPFMAAAVYFPPELITDEFVDNLCDAFLEARDVFDPAERELPDDVA